MIIVIIVTIIIIMRPGFTRNFRCRGSSSRLRRCTTTERNPWSGVARSEFTSATRRHAQRTTRPSSSYDRVYFRYTVIPLYRGSVHPLQDVALRITSPVVSLSGISAPSDSFHLHDVVSPSLHLSTS